MKKAVLLLTVLFAGNSFGQCPFPVKLDSIGIGCLPNDTLFVESAHSLSSITWLYNEIPAATVTASIVIKPLQNAVTVAGGNGAGAAFDQFNNPSSLFIDAAGFLYVADRSNFRVIKFPPGSTGNTNGVVIAGGNGPGRAMNQFQPNAVFVDAGGNLYVADDANSRVLKFPPGSTTATNGTVVAGGNGAGKAANQLVNPVSVFIDESNSLFVVDAFNDRIQKFPPNSSGRTDATTVAGGNGYGNGANQFNGPAAVFVDKAGYIYVDDAANNRIQKFPPNSTSATNGVTIAGGNGFGSAANQLSTPSSVWVDDQGNVYVADINNQRIQMFPPGSASYTPGTTVAGGNGQGFAANQFSGPNTVWGDNKGNLYVSDIGNNRVQKFALQPVKQYLIDTTFIALVTGTYTAVVTDTSGCTVTTNDVIVKPNVTPSISVRALPNTIVQCTQTKAAYSFAATSVNEGASPSYQWQVNGKNAGGNSSSFIADVFNGDVVSCVLKSSATCAIPSTVTSNPVAVSFAAKPMVRLQNTVEVCAGLDTLFINGESFLTTIAWYKNGIIDTLIQTTGGVKIDTSYRPITSGDYYAIATNKYGCTDTTKTITANATTKPQITIQTDKTSLCAGDAETFFATVTNGSSAPLYQWLVNNKAISENRSRYVTSSLQSNDAVSCIVYGDKTSCFDNDTSSAIIPLINSLPQFKTVKDIVISLGQSTVLSLPVSGNIIHYAWSPSSTLSNPSVVNPVASPLQTTLYTLHVLSADSCAANDSIKVIVSSPFLIPAAFSPNSDGLNDKWYMHGGKAGDIIQSLRIFSRQGRIVYSVNNMASADKQHGWDGMYKGQLQSPGTYVYEAVIVSDNNNRSIYKGTIVLIR